MKLKELACHLAELFLTLWTDHASDESLNHAMVWSAVVSLQHCDRAVCSHRYLTSLHRCIVSCFIPYGSNYCINGGKVGAF